MKKVLKYFYSAIIALPAILSVIMVFWTILL